MMFNRRKGSLMMKKIYLSLLVGICISFLQSCGHTQENLGKTVTVGLEPKSGTDTDGVVTLVQTEAGVQIKGRVTGLEPNSQHGMHVHEIGDCDAEDATSAGGHYAPGANPHGSPYERNHHLGDLGNITADTDGVATFTLLVDKANIYEDQKNSFLNRALIIHKDRDDLKSQPSGDSGIRIACGVIE